MAEDAMDATLLCDADGIVIAWSSCAEALLGWTREEAIGKSLMNLVIPLQYRSVVESNVREFCATGAGALFNKRLEAVLLCKDRHAILIEFMATPIRLDGRLYFSASIRARHSDAKSAKDPARHISILNLSRDAIMITNLENEILFWNSGAEKMFGYAAEESLGRKSHELLSAEYPLALTEINDQLMATGHWEGEISYTTFNGVRLTILSRWELEPDVEDGTALILKSGTDAGL
jgi:rsbT co-antagonist protein RsbR